MHRTVKPRPHHLGDAASIVAVRLVDLRLQHRLHVPRLDTDHWQACFGECAEEPLRQRTRFQSNPLEAVGGVLQHRQQRLRFACQLHFPNDLARVIHNADAGLLDDAMDRGVPLIYHAALTAGSWLGYADFLVRIVEACPRWAWSYEPWDAKLARTARPEHVLQIALYGDLLGHRAGPRTSSRQSHAWHGRAGD